MSRYLPPPYPVVVDDRLADGILTRGRRCLACDAWAALHATLRHVAGCRAGDAQ